MDWMAKNSWTSGKRKIAPVQWGMCALLEFAEDLRPVTVAMALDNYEADLKVNQGDLVNATRIKKHLPVAIANRRVDQLSMNELRNWRDALAQKMKLASVNRTCAAFKAALNLADKDRRISIRHAWIAGLKAFSDADESRTTFVAEHEVLTIIANAYTYEPEFGLFVEVAAQTGARPSQNWTPHRWRLRPQWRKGPPHDACLI